MHIGIPREMRDGEARVSLTPISVRQISSLGHTVVVERNVGAASGFSDQDYTSAGAMLVYSAEEVYRRSDLIIKVMRPTMQEVEQMRDGTALMSFLHLASAPPSRIEALIRNRLTAIAFESIETDSGDRPVIHAMSMIGGRLVPFLASHFLEIGSGGNGVLLSGAPGVPPAEVVIIGAGMFGQEAARVLTNLGASVYVLDRDVNRLIETEQRCKPRRVITMLAHSETIAKVIRFADVVIAAVNQPGHRAPIVITEQMIRTMRPGSLVMDIAIDQGGCVETSRPTTHRDPVFRYAGVTHYCVPNIAAAVARTSTNALANALWPFLEQIAHEGVQGAIDHNPALARAAWIRNGVISERYANTLHLMGLAVGDVVP